MQEEEQGKRRLAMQLSLGIRRQAVRYLALFAMGSFSMAGCVHANEKELLCESSGMAGVVFGERIEGSPARVVEVTDLGVTYYRLEPPVNIQPFEALIVGVTPTSRKVFSIALWRYGDAAKLDQMIAEYKKALTQAHSSIIWRVVGNHHYGEQVEGLDLAIFRIGDLVNGKPTNWLSYDCDSKQFLGIVLKEAREANDEDNS